MNLEIRARQYIAAALDKIPLERRNDVEAVAEACVAAAIALANEVRGRIG
jgi:hypothetical protein